MTKDGGFSAVLTTDNEWIYYQYGEAGPLRRMRVDGTESTVVANGRIDNLQYTANQSGVYFVVRSGHRSELERVAGDRSNEPLLQLPFTPGLGLSVSPDGRYVLVTKPDENGTDLMLVEGFR